MARNTNGGTTIRDTPAELVHASSLMQTSHPLGIALAIDGDVLHVALLKLAHGSLNSLHATIFAHFSGGDVGVETGAVPVTWDRFGGKGDLNAIFFSDTVEEEARHPELIAHCREISSLSLQDGGFHARSIPSQGPT